MVLRLILDEKEGKAIEGNNDWIWSNACWWERFLEFENILFIYKFDKFNFITKI